MTLQSIFIAIALRTSGTSSFKPSTSPGAFAFDAHVRHAFCSLLRNQGFRNKLTEERKNIYKVHIREREKKKRVRVHSRPFRAACADGRERLFHRLQTTKKEQIRSNSPLQNVKNKVLHPMPVSNKLRVTSCGRFRHPHPREMLASFLSPRPPLKKNLLHELYTHCSRKPIDATVLFGTPKSHTKMCFSLLSAYVQGKAPKKHAALLPLANHRPDIGAGGLDLSSSST